MAMKQPFLSLPVLRLTADIELALLERQQDGTRQSVSETRDKQVENIVATLTMSICCPRVALPSDCSTAKRAGGVSGHASHCDSIGFPHSLGRMPPDAAGERGKNSEGTM